MTNPKITYNHGWSQDCNDTTGWSADGAHEDGNTATLTVDNDDIFNINVSASVGNKSCYYEYDFTDVSSTTYTTFIARYKTSDNSIRAKIVLVFTVGTQTVLDETSSTNWATATIDITAAKTIDKIRIYATQATGDVYYDFLLICAGQFTWPHVGPGGVFPDFENKIPRIPIPGRDGDIQQHLGMKSPVIVIEGDADSAEAWQSAGNPHFEYLFKAFHKDVWNWFTCDYPKLRFQVMFRRFEPRMEVSEGKATMKYRVTLDVYKRSSLGLDTWGDVEWLGNE